MAIHKLFSCLAFLTASVLLWYLHLLNQWWCHDLQYVLLPNKT